MVLGHYLHISFLFLDLQITTMHLDVINPSHIHRRFDFDWRFFFPFFEIMVSCMATSYGPQVAQMNEKLPSESFLDLTLTQHSHDENPELWEVHAHFEIEPPRTWYYHISPNSHIIVILLQVDPASNDEPETVCKCCYETKDIFIFTWSSILDIGHYCWLRGPIRWLPPNNRADYLIRTIQHILNFLQLWTIIVVELKT